jgi:hypothetical protein
VTDRKEGYIVRKLQRGLDTLVAWWEGWNIKINEDKTLLLLLPSEGTS